MDWLIGSNRNRKNFPTCIRSKQSAAYDKIVSGWFHMENIGLEPTTLASAARKKYVLLTRLSHCPEANLLKDLMHRYISTTQCG